MKLTRLFGRHDGADPAPVPAQNRKVPPVRTRSYRAAVPDRLVGGFSSLFTTTSREVTRRDIRGLVNHARYAARNFDHARAYEMLCRRHVIGPDGIRLQMDVREPDGRPDKLANEQIGAAWKRWGRKGAPTICGRLSWWDVERLAVTHIAREGGLFIREWRGRSAFGYQVELIPFDLLDLDLTQPLPGGAYIESGLEFDGNGRLMAAHFWTVPADQAHRPTHRRRFRVPASELIHLMIPEEVGAALGVPRSATALRLMNMGEQFEESAMAAADMGARQSVFYEQEAGTEVTAGLSADDAPDALEPGSSMLLPPGVKANMPAPPYPEAAVGPFMQHMARGEAAGLGVAYETLTADMSGANFSTLHAGKTEERDEWRMFQRSVFEGLHDRVFLGFLKGAMLTGQVRLPMAKLDKFDAAVWRPRGWSAVDPLKQANADRVALETGTKSLTEITAARGRDVGDLIAERNAEAAAFKAAGLPVPPQGGGGPEPQPQEDEDE